MKDEMLCPRCGVPMVPAAGIPGIWQCPNREDHEFTEDPWENETGAEPRSRKQSRPEGKPDPPQRCPRCRAPMKTDDLGPYCDSPVHKGVYRPPTEHWLARIGITTALPSTPQSNITDGAACLMLGDLKRGGGAKSGRKRKKPPKRTRGSNDFFGV